MHPPVMTVLDYTENNMYICEYEVELQTFDIHQIRNNKKQEHLIWNNFTGAFCSPATFCTDCVRPAGEHRVM